MASVISSSVFGVFPMDLHGFFDYEASKEVLDYLIGEWGRETEKTAFDPIIDLLLHMTQRTHGRLMLGSKDGDVLCLSIQGEFAEYGGTMCREFVCMKREGPA